MHAAIARFVAALCFALPALAADRPDIVVFLADDHGYLDSPVTNPGSAAQTPNLERLAADGVLMTHMFVGSPTCAPSRAILLTGLNSARNGAEPNHAKIKPGVPMLIDPLRDAGYEVAAFGKVLHGGDPLKVFDAGDKRSDPELIADYLDARDADRPLVLFVGSKDPHVPWPEESDFAPDALDLPAGSIDTPETRAFRARYYTDLAAMDALLGEVRALTHTKLGDNTLFLYTSDHGAQWPWAKWNLYDAGVRSLTVAAWPGVIEPGTTTDALAGWIDLLPTLIDVAGGAAPQDITGRSFAPVLRGERDAHREEIFLQHSAAGHNCYPMRAMRTGQYKYIRNLRPDFVFTTQFDHNPDSHNHPMFLAWRAAALRDAGAAAVLDRLHHRPAEELYDLAADPHEQHNLADDPAHQGRLLAMRERLTRWMEDEGDAGTVFGKPMQLNYD